MIKLIYKYIHIIWLLIIFGSLLLSPETLLISLSYFLAPVFIVFSGLVPNIKIFTTNAIVGGWEAILVILILLSSIILLFKLILRMIKKCLKRLKDY